MNDVVTPWQLYLACRASGLSRQTELSDFCNLRLPAISRIYTDTELNQWRAVYASLPSNMEHEIHQARQQAEGELVAAAHRVSTASVGVGEFSFKIGEDTLSRDQQRVLNQIAVGMKQVFDSDSQAVDVVGFADRGSDATLVSNEALAERRGQYVAGFLRRVGIPEEKINVRARTVLNPQGDAGIGQRFRKVEVGGSRSSLTIPTETTERGGFGLSPAEMAIGASDFLIERAKDELQSYVLRVGLNRFCNEGSIYVLLRYTCALLPRETDAERYIPVPAALQEALRADLRELPYTVTETVLAQINRTNPAVSERALIAISLVRYLRAVTGGIEPLPALAVWDTDFLKIGDQSVAIPPRLRQIATIARFSWSARNDLSAQVTGSALQDTAALYVMKALVLYGRNRQQSGPMWQDWISSNDPGRLNHILLGIRTAQRVATDVEGAWSALRDASRDSASAAQRTDIVAELVASAASMFNIQPGLGNVAPDPLLRSAVLEPGRDFVVALAGDDPRAALSSLVRLIQLGIESGTVRLPSEYNRLLGFTNDATQARSAAEFNSALENLVGPPGGYLAKRESRTRYARLNAFVGGSAHYEYIPQGVGSGSGLAIGLAVPVGVELGIGLRGRRSSGVFLQVLDLGALASARIIGSDSVESLPDFKLGSIVGPGVFYSFGWSDAPISTLAGLAYFPEGREATDGSRVGVVRGSVVLAIDIPLFP